MNPFAIDLGTILTPEECYSLAGEFMQEYHTKNLQQEGVTNPDYYGNSFGTVTKGSWDLLHRLTPEIQKHAPNPIVAANPYCRIYLTDSKLRVHKDRPPLDWTLSVCLFTNLDHEWPLYAKTDDGVISIPTIVGRAGLVTGQDTEHWRDDLFCRPDQHVIQLFLHWSNA